MTILFTGHRGFLGRELIPLLSQDFEIVTYDGDLVNHELLLNFIERNSISHVIHAAAKVSNRWETDTSDNLINNLKMTLNIVNLCLPVLTFCSGKVYGYQKSIDNVSENDAGKRYPDDFYGQGKYIIRKLIEDKSSVNLLRFFNVFGKSEDSRKFIKANILRYVNKEPMTVDQDIIYDFFYVNDALPLIRSWIQEKAIPKELNLVYSQKMKLSDVCNLINALGNHRVDIEIKESATGKNYYANGTNLNDMHYSLLGLEKGLQQVYTYIVDNERT